MQDVCLDGYVYIKNKSTYSGGGIGSLLYGSGGNYFVDHHTDACTIADPTLPSNGYQVISFSADDWPYNEVLPIYIGEDVCWSPSANNFRVGYSSEGTDWMTAINYYTTLFLWSHNVNLDAGIDQEICHYDDAQLEATGASIYSWTPISAVNDATISNPYTNIIESTNFTVTGTKTFTNVQNAYNTPLTCSTTDEVEVTILTAPLPYDNNYYQCGLDGSGPTFDAGPEGVSLVNGPPAYQWFYNGNSTHGIARYYTPNSNSFGTYTCIVTGSSGCSSTMTFEYGLVEADFDYNFNTSGNDLTIQSMTDINPSTFSEPLLEVHEWWIYKAYPNWEIYQTLDYQNGGDYISPFTINGGVNDYIILKHSVSINNCSQYHISHVFAGRINDGLEKTNNINFSTLVISSINIYPNPVDDIAHIAFNLVDSKNVRIEVLDLTGRVVYIEEMGQLSSGTQLIDIDAKQIGNGMYIFNIYAGAERISERVSISK